jgi:plastocyanin
MRFMDLVLITSILIATTYIFGCPALSVSLGEVYPPPPQYVDIINSSFVPDNITVPLNTTVVWSNHDVNEETVTAVDGSFNSRGIIPAGFEYRYIFLQPGWYEYYSMDHTSMRGMVVVKAADGSIPPRPPQLAAKAPAALMANVTTKAPGVTAPTQAGGTAAQSATIGLIAKNIAFNTSTITVPAGANVTVNFDNQDSGIPHNFAVYETSAAQNAIFTGKIITGPAKTTYTFTAPSKPGNYYFQCNVHPTQMNGQFIVTQAAASSQQSGAAQMNASASTNATIPPTAPLANVTANATKAASAVTPSNVSGAQGATIGLIAKNIAFNTSTITVPAGANVTVNFDNQDSGIPHNFAVYESSAAQNAIFKGQIITGPAKTTYAFTAPSKPGTYYFRCDVHPNQMNGQFVVTQAAASSQQNASQAANAAGGVGVPPIRVEMNRFMYNPDNITVNVGTTVAWTNYDGVNHTVTADDGSFDSGIINPGQRFNHTFTEIGRFNYHDKDHPFMRGSVAVIYYTSLPETAAAAATPAAQNASTVNASTSAAPSPSGRNISANASSARVSRINASANMTKAPAAPAANVTANATKATSAVPSSNASGAQSATIGLIAKNIAFNRSTITVPAGANVTVNFDNQDSGIPHNFAIYQSSATKNAIFRGQIITGPKKTTYTFTAPSNPGNYYFQCDVHPNQMNGPFIVTPQ